MIINIDPTTKQQNVDNLSKLTVNGENPVPSTLLHNLRNSISPSILGQSLIREYFSAFPIRHMEMALEELNTDQLSKERREKLNSFLSMSLEQIKIIQTHINDHLDKMEQNAGLTEKILDDIEKHHSSIAPFPG